MPVTLMLFVKIPQLHTSALAKQALKGTENTVKVTALLVSEIFNIIVNIYILFSKQKRKFMITFFPNS